MDPIGTDSLSRRQVSWPCRAVLCDRLRSHSSNQESRYKILSGSAIPIHRVYRLPAPPA
ncbi:uncharacterized protein [Zea mays]|uniref:Uncharacterized protein n=1 Tax=Zea mays TaxID=4577 RepID=B6SLJ7_MAIZE|nr:uncharacterized protein LOC100303949 [Zea mays]ACG25730.1 hypothetical protein [Zea mays]|eukprot:NP_001158982.2 uncharacterized protein LOC100303949 [Zea mays]